MLRVSAGFAEITETTEMTKTTGIWAANHGFPKEKFARFSASSKPTWICTAQFE